MSNAIQTTANNSVIASATVGTASTLAKLTDFVETNYLLIMLFFTLASMLIGLAFHIINFVVTRKKNRLEKRLRIIELSKSLNKTEEEIEILLNVGD